MAITGLLVSDNPFDILLAYSFLKKKINNIYLHTSNKLIT